MPAGQHEASAASVAEAPPRSGVAGLSPRQVRYRLAENGWAGVPIMAHDANAKAAGKAPTIKQWQRFAEFDAELPTGADRRRWEREGAGTGIACGNVVAIDIDVRDVGLVTEIADLAAEVFGATPFVRQGSAPKTLLVYRAAESIPKRNLKANDGSGDGLDVIGAGAQFVAFGIHPRTCRPYAWLGDETPLTASPEAAPLIAAAQIEAFLDRVRAILPLTKTGGRPRGAGGQSAEIVWDAEGYVIDGRELWLARCVWRSVTRLHLAGEQMTEAAVVATAWPEFERTARVEVNGRRWSKEDCAAKVRGTLDRVCRRQVALPPRPIEVEATYPDDALPLAGAEAEIARLVADFFERDAPTFKGERTLYEIAHAANPIVLPPKPRGVALRVEAGIGKTEAAIRAIAPALRRGLSVVYAVPTVELGDAITARFAAVGVDARVWRGRDQPDPNAPGERMCRDLQAVADARRAGAYSVSGAVCSKKIRGSKPLQCRFFAVCGHVRQKQAEPVLWIVTHGMLFNDKPGNIPKADALVIDESFYSKAIPDKAAVLAVDAIERGGLPDDYASARALQSARSALVDALRQAADGPLARADLYAAGVTADTALKAKKLEWSRYVEPSIVPGQSPSDREERADIVADVNREVKLLAGLWAEIGDFLDGDFAASGRLTVAQDKSSARVIRRRSLNTLHDDWRCPTLILDATAPPDDILSIALGMPVKMRASIRAQWHGSCRVRQVVGGPQTSNALGANRQGGGDRSLAELARYVALQAAHAFPLKVGVVIQKELVERFVAHGLGPNVEVRHFGALAGLDHWRAFGGVILIGRTAPPPGSMEASAGVLIGQPVSPSVERPFTTGGILLREGRVIGTNRVIRLADPMAEALRWQVCEANLVQALGRIRPLRDHGRRRFFVDVLCDVPLPIVVDEAKRWDEVRPAPWAAMAAEGVVFTSVADVMKARSDLAPTEKAARCLLEESPSSALTPKEESSLDVRADRSLSSRRLRIKRAGREPTEIFILPNGPRGRPEQRRYLEERLGPLAEMVAEGKARPFAAIGVAVSARIERLASAISQATRIGADAGRVFAEIGFEEHLLAMIHEAGDKGIAKDALLHCELRPTAEQRDIALQRLRDAGRIVETTVRGRGRPSKRFTVVPDDE